MSRPQASAELETLVTALLDQQISDNDARRLWQLLEDDADARAYYLQQVEIHARLRVELGGHECDPIADAELAGNVALMPSVEPARSDNRPLWIGLAVAAALLLLAIPAYLLNREDPVAAGPPRPPVATLSAVFDAQWQAGSAELQPGARLSPGRLKLGSGVIEITFDNGASVAVEGPAIFEPLKQDIGRLHSGRLVAYVPEKAQGFLIETEKARVVDLGTQFGVEVTSGETVVQVFQGRVETQVKESANQEWHTVREGQAIKIGPQAAVPAEEPFAPGQFVRELPPPGKQYAPSMLPRHDRIAIKPARQSPEIDGDLSDWDRSGAFFSSCREPYAANYNVTGYMMYDRQHVYIAAVVADPHPMANSMDPKTNAGRLWMGGGLQVRLSTDRKRPWPVQASVPMPERNQPGGPGDLSDQLVHMTLWYASQDRKARLHLAYGMDLHGDTIDPAGFQGAFVRGDDKHSYTLEYAIPWQALNAAAAPPAAGDELAASWMVHWSDRTGREKRAYLVEIFNQQQAKDWTRTFKEAATWGRAVYE